MGSLLNTLDSSILEELPKRLLVRTPVAPTHHTHVCRYELKYLVEEERARGCRDFTRPYLQRDRYARAELAYSYPIYTLYLDDPGLSLYRSTLHGHKNRYKLRIRYYDYDPNTPLFFEIKRRVGDVIIKERTPVRKNSLQRLMAGACPLREDLCAGCDADDYLVLRRFCELRGAIHARPILHNRYMREAWVAPHDSKLRVSYDRLLVTAPYSGSIEPPNWFDAKLPAVVLELKFNDRFPRWMQELVSNWDLYRAPMAKYVHCTDQMPYALRLPPLGTAVRSPHE